jgi:threonine dehydrogenase-like Zn-dependent dehydrogenase
MRALRFEKGELKVTDRPYPDSSSETVVKVLLAGICDTDLQIVRGYFGFEGTLGHEFVGIIENSPDRSRIGKRVVGEINAGCGRCNLCRSGDTRHCPERSVLGILKRDGSFADYLQLPEENLLEVPDGVPTEAAVFTEPLAAACGVLERTRIGSDSRVAVIGDGKIGLLCARVLLGSGVRPLLIGKHEAKLRIASNWGIETVKLDQLKTERLFDQVVECSGSSDGLQLALSIIKPRGEVVLKSTYHGNTEINSSMLVVDEISIIGSRCGRFAPALDLLSKGLDLRPLIDEEYLLKDGLKAMERAATKGVLKVLLRPS